MRRLLRAMLLLMPVAAIAQTNNNQHTVPYPRIDNTIGYKVDPNWPSEKAPGAEWAAMSGLTVAPDGNVWTFNRGKIPVQVFNPQGNLLGIIEFPEQPANCDFGGKDMKTLYVTARTSVYSVPMEAAGHVFGGGKR